jgi:hypothetical protein
MNAKSIELADGSRLTLAELCADLGMDPNGQIIVTITSRGTISFRCGTPYEIRQLLGRCYARGQIPSAKLVRAGRQ